MSTSQVNSVYVTTITVAVLCVCLIVRTADGVYLSLKETNYTNNSVINITDIGESVIGNNGVVSSTQNNGLQCITDRRPCCKSKDSESIKKRDWYYPNGTQVPNKMSNHSIYRNRGDNGTVNLNRRNNAMMSTGLFCCVVPDATGVNQTVCANIIGAVYLSLKGMVYANNSVISITEIGETDVMTSTQNNGLQCITNKMPCCKGDSVAGEWYGPNGTVILPPGTSTIDFYRNRGDNGTVNLNRRYNAMMPTGLFCCVVPDATGVNRTICANIIGTTHTTTSETTTSEAPTTRVVTMMHTDTVDIPSTTYSSTSETTSDAPTNGGVTEMHTETVDVQSVYLSLKGKNYNTNNSVINITEIGETVFKDDVLVSDQNNGLQCITDRRSCCRTARVGHWYYPNKTVVPGRGSDTGPDIYRNRGDDGTVYLNHRNNAMMSTGLFCCLVPDATGVDQTVCANIIGAVYLSLNGVIYANNSVISITEIGETNVTSTQNNGLQCITNKMPCCSGDSGAGEWYHPDGTVLQVRGGNTGPGPDIYRNRGNDGTVNLNRRNNAIMPTGLFCCVVPDATDVNWRMCANITVLATSSSTTYSSSTTSTTTDFTKITERVSVPIIAGAVVGVPLLLMFTTSICIIVYVISRSRKKATLSADRKGLVHFSSTVKAAEYDDVVVPEHNYEDVELTDVEIKDHSKPIPLTEFGEYVSHMHVDRDKLFEEQFNSISITSQYSHSVSQNPSNTEKNRFLNIYSYDYNRVKISRDTQDDKNDDTSDYINASFLDMGVWSVNDTGASNNDKIKYIAAQGPLPNTVEDFWWMIWEQKTTTLVMLTKCFEGRVKCERYWPENREETLKFGQHLSVTLIKSTPFTEFVIRHLTVQCVTAHEEDSPPPLEVIQFHFTAWPDHGVPTNSSIMLNFIRRVRQHHPYSNSCPILVHCSAGVGRTGTFIVLDSMLERMKSENSYNIYEFVSNLREQRASMVQSLAQYMFIHDALKEMLLCGNTEIQAASLRIVINKLSKKVDRESDMTGFEHQFRTLDTLCPKYNQESLINATATHNTSKNRYQDKIPNDKCRVMLRMNQGSDYINASGIDGYKHMKAYIATQGPLESTVNDFWRMIWELKSCCIVMLCHLQEDEQEMCVHYWPEESDEPQMYGKLSVKLLSETTQDSYIMRKFEIDDTKSDTSSLNIKTSITVTQFQVLVWPVNETPKVTSLIELMDNVNKVQMRSGNRPMTVMCNDGCGRTGTFICIHAQLERLKTEGVVDFFQSVKAARIQRPGLVSDVAQYELCHNAVMEYVSKMESYENFKQVV